MTRRQLAAALREAGVPSPEHEAEMLLCELFSLTPAALPADPARDFSSPRLDDALARRKRREPLQYILGKAYFCGEVYLLNDACLIPRPDTELLVETAVKLLPENGRFADLFCGSGCVGISLAAARRDARGVGTDLSEKALEAARKNAAENGTADRISFFAADIRNAPLGEERYDLITANPPYLTESEMRALQPEVAFEPRAALDGGPDGLLFYRITLDLCSENLRPDGAFLFEIGYRQGAAVTALAESRGYRATPLRDLGGNDRVLLLKKYS